MNKKLKSTIKKRKLVAGLLTLLLVVFGFMAYDKYQDWDNAQMIKGLARDYPLLIAEVEQETGLNLEIQSNCMTTQEKYGSGVNTCELLTRMSNVPQEAMDKLIKVSESSNSFKKSKIYENSEGYNYAYRNKNSCEVRYQEYVYISCITAVRDANKQLAREEFSKIN